VVITVTELRSSLGRLDGASYRPLFPNEPRRRQERQPVYEEAGIAYVVSTDHLRKTGRIMADTTPLAVVVSDLEAVDINTPLDFEYCQFLMEKAK